MKTKHFIKLPAYRDVKVEKDIVKGEEDFRVYRVELDKITIDALDIQGYRAANQDEYSDYIDIKTGFRINQRNITAVFLNNRQGTVHVAMIYEEFDNLFQGILAQNNIEYTDLT